MLWLGFENVVDWNCKMDCGHFDMWACGIIKWKIYVHFEFFCAAFRNLNLDLDLDFKLINLKLGISNLLILEVISNPSILKV